jgi:hypothetical protein
MPGTFRFGSIRAAATIAAASLASLHAAPAQALNIVLSYNAAASTEPATDPTGAQLTAIMQHVEATYEDIFETAHTITISYWYQSLGAGVLGGHGLVSQSGGRETAGEIAFDPAAAGAGWFFDPTPADNSEFTVQQLRWRDLSNGQRTGAFNFGADIPQTFEVGFSGSDNGSDPAVASRFDLLSVALHETGHALGMSAANTSTVAQTNDGDYDFASVNVFGKTLAAEHATGSISHLDMFSSLMFPGMAPATRVLPSHTDLLSMAAAHSYTQLDLPRREFYGGTDWNTASNWSGNAVPGATDEAFVRRSGPADEARDVTLSANGLAGTLNILESSTVHTSNRLLAVGTAIVDGASSTLFVESGGTLTATTVVLRDSAQLQVSGDTIVSGALQLENATTVNFASGSLSCGSLQVTGARVLVAGGADKVLRTGSIAVNASGQIDLNDNKAIVNYGAADPSPVQTIRQFIQIGYNGGAWNGNRITTSMGDGSFGLGYADNAVLGFGSFGGISVDASSVLITFAYFGDADLNGQVDVADLGLLATNWQASGLWTDGDFDYSGSIDVNDLGLLATNWQAGVGGAPSLDEALVWFGLGGANVPEPEAIGVWCAVALNCHRRRRIKQAVPPSSLPSARRA